MDRKGLKEKIKETLKNKKKLALILLPILLVVGGGGFYALKMGSDQTGKAQVTHTTEKKDSETPTEQAHASQAPKQSKGFWKIVWGAIVSVQEKVNGLSLAEEQNQRLRLENANLRRWAESVQFDCSLVASEARTRETALELNIETGAKVGRLLSSIQYRVPTHLLPDQLYTLGVSHYMAAEFERAAVIFTHLTGLDKNDSFKTARNYLLTGITWYRLDHFNLADDYFDKVLSYEEDEEVIQYQAQARLWRALSADRKNHHTQSQHWLKELVDHHPYSAESSWVNTNKAERKPAAEGVYRANDFISDEAEDRGEGHGTSTHDSGH